MTCFTGLFGRRVVRSLVIRTSQVASGLTDCAPGTTPLQLLWKDQSGLYPVKSVFAIRPAAMPHRHGPRGAAAMRVAKGPLV